MQKLEAVMVELQVL